MAWGDVIASPNAKIPTANMVGSSTLPTTAVREVPMTGEQTV